MPRKQKKTKEEKIAESHSHLMNANKIHIIGGLGSGKTYLGKELSNFLKISYFNLDKIYYGNSNKDQRNKEFNKIISRREWIIEGHWHDWVKKGFVKSDKIIFLDINLFRRDINLFIKLIKRKFNLEEGRKLGFKDFLEMIKLNHQWNKTKVKSIIKKYKNKTLIFNKADKALHQ